MKNALLFFAFALIASAAPTSLQFIQPAAQVVPLPNGAILSFRYASQTNTSPLLVISDASGNQLASLPAASLGSGQSSVTAAATDSAGNIWITGQTTSANFPLVHPIYSTPSAYSPPSAFAFNAFVVKLDPGLNILFSTFLQGQPVAGESSPSVIALDRSGNAYIAGVTSDPNFPVTGPIFGRGAPASGVSASTPLFNTISDTFVAEIPADGSKLIFSRLLGGVSPICPYEGSNCFVGGAYDNTFTVPSALAVDQAGSVVVAGETNAFDFPVTVSPYPSPGTLFVTRIAPGGGQMEWSTEVGANSYFYGPSAQSVALDSSGNVYIGGTSPGPIAGTPNSLQPTVQYTTGLPHVAFVMKLSLEGTRILYATNLSGAKGSELAGITFDASGNVWATGYTTSSDFPGLSGVPASGVDFALELNADASALTQIFSFLPNTINSAPVFDSFGRILLLGDTGNLLRWNPDPAATTSAVFALSSSAVPSSTAGAAPGELATFYGVGIGPANAIAATPDSDGVYPTTLGGVSVGFSAGFFVIPAPLLYVGPNQINFQVPFAVSPTMPLIVTTPTGRLPALSFSDLPSLGIFGVINSDGTVNSQTNPAPAGSAVALYVTGLGAPNSSSQNGAISTTADNSFQNSVKVENVTSSGTLRVLYAGSAPTLINGLDQINVQLPTLQDPELEIQTANAGSNEITVYTH